VRFPGGEVSSNPKKKSDEKNKENYKIFVNKKNYANFSNSINKMLKDKIKKNCYTKRLLKNN